MSVGGTLIIWTQGNSITETATLKLAIIENIVEKTAGGYSDTPMFKVALEDETRDGAGDQKKAKFWAKLPVNRKAPLETNADRK